MDHMYYVFINSYYNYLNRCNISTLILPHVLFYPPKYLYHYDYRDITMNQNGSITELSQFLGHL